MDIANIMGVLLIIWATGACIAAIVLNHRDWINVMNKMPEENWEQRIDNMVAGSWYTVLGPQRKWIIKEIKHKMKIWRK